SIWKGRQPSPSRSTGKGGSYPPASRRAAAISYLIGWHCALSAPLRHTPRRPPICRRERCISALRSAFIERGLGKYFLRGSAQPVASPSCSHSFFGPRLSEPGGASKFFKRAAPYSTACFFLIEWLMPGVAR